MSYAGQVGFGLLGDLDALPDLPAVAEGIEASLTELVALASRRAAGGAEAQAEAAQAFLQAGLRRRVRQARRGAGEARAGGEYRVGMNAERSQAYGRVTKLLQDVGPTKLQPAEQEIVREAADTLLFCEDVTADSAAHDAMATVDALIERLVDADRWMPERAEELRRDVESCGPAVWA